ncbi:MAG TPA: hypothetical protein VJU14_03405 [Solirubrobacterales bacterium]|nr:hypothetical protein [Solirubrobacterales bacterium]
MAVLAVAAIALGTIFVATRDKEAGHASCGLSVAALAILTKLAHSGESPRVMLAEAGLPLACGYFVNALAEDPSREVEAQVELPSGDADVVEQAAGRFVEPAPAPVETGPDVSDLLECARWENELLYRFCSEGRLSPPS